MSIKEHDQKLTEVLELLPGSCQIDDYQLAGMGWAAVLSSGRRVITLHSDRGWVDVYQGRYTDQQLITCKQLPAEIAEVISSHAI